MDFHLDVVVVVVQSSILFHKGEACGGIQMEQVEVERLHKRFQAAVMVGSRDLGLALLRDPDGMDMEAGVHAEWNQDLLLSYLVADMAERMHLELSAPRHDDFGVLSVWCV